MLIASTAYWDYRKRLLQFEERRVSIENGMEPPPLPSPAMAGWPGVKQQELQLKYQERRLMIEKGLTPADDPQPKPTARHEYLWRGIVSTALRVAALAAYGLLGEETAPKPFWYSMAIWNSAASSSVPPHRSAIGLRI